MICLESGPVEGAEIQRNVLAVSTNGLKPFYLKNLLGPPDPTFSETKTDYNLYWHAENSRWAEEHLVAARKENQELHSLSGNPVFRNSEKGDFRFKAGSPATKLGIEPIDLRKAGLKGR